MNQRGNTKIKGIIALLITVAVIIGLVKVVPVYVRSYELKDTIRNEAKFAGVEQRTPDEVRERVFAKAKELNLPVSRDQIQVSKATGGVRVTTRYTVPVDLYLLTHDFAFNFSYDTASAY